MPNLHALVQQIGSPNDARPDAHGWETVRVWHLRAEVCEIGREEAAREGAPEAAAEARARRAGAPPRRALARVALARARAGRVARLRELRLARGARVARDILVRGWLNFYIFTLKL